MLIFLVHWHKTPISFLRSICSSLRLGITMLWILGCPASEVDCPSLHCSPLLFLLRLNITFYNCFLTLLSITLQCSGNRASEGLMEAWFSLVVSISFYWTPISSIYHSPSMSYWKIIDHPPGRFYPFFLLLKYNPYFISFIFMDVYKPMVSGVFTDTNCNHLLSRIVLSCSKGIPFWVCFDVLVVTYWSSFNFDEEQFTQVFWCRILESTGDKLTFMHNFSAILFHLMYSFWS